MPEPNLRQALDEFMDWLADLSEAEIRYMFADRRIPCDVDFSWTIGGTEYIVTSHFNQYAGEDIFHKLTRLLEDEVGRENNALKC